MKRGVHLRRQTFGKQISTVFLVAGLMGLVNGTARAVTVGEAFPAIATTHVESSRTSPVELQGKVTMINFWATWCESCKVELKEMESDFKALFSDQAFQAKFVSLDKDASKASDWFKKNLTAESGMYTRLFADPEFKAADVVGVDAFPMTVLIDKNGKVSHIQRGFKPGEHQTATLVRIAGELLKK